MWGAKIKLKRNGNWNVNTTRTYTLEYSVYIIQWYYSTIVYNNIFYKISITAQGSYMKYITMNLYTNTTKY